MTAPVAIDCAHAEPAKLVHSPLREGAAWALARVATSLHATFGPRTHGAFGILMYHRVSEEFPSVVSPTINVTPARLREQLSGLLTRGFTPWTLERLIAASDAGEQIPAKVFAVTFDDGFANNLTAALPILESLSVPATLFLATAFLDSPDPFPNDNWPGAGASQIPDVAWRPLTTDECRRLQASGLVSLGAHTHTHQFFVERPEEFRADLARCVSILRERFGVERPTFSFPFGLASPELVAIAKQSGVCCGLMTQPDCVQSGEDPFRWGRFGVTTADTPATLAAKLGGWYSPLARSLRAAQRPLALIGPRRLREHLHRRNPSFAFAGENTKPTAIEI
jgi:peptidoglycan/xylan/chitin deacetylase (PgdA/CDA1 family)